MAPRRSTEKQLCTRSGKPLGRFGYSLLGWTARAAGRKHGDPERGSPGSNPSPDRRARPWWTVARNTTRSIWLILPVTYACLKD